MLLTISGLAAVLVGVFLIGYVLGRETPSMREWERRRILFRRSRSREWP